MEKIYLIGALRNEQVPHLGNALRDLGFDVVDDWHGTGYEADEKWREYEQIRGRNYKEALQGLAAKHIFQFDKHHLDTSDFVVMLLPAGRSGHLEFGYAIGQGKPGYILFDGEPDRYDVMYQFANDIFFDSRELLETLRKEYDC
ncbi:hypothetical protein LCGC14_1328290 [marine sediment metagenome]|uniref:Nucleoside 2-deoxyribosyltransferase n=1 Tax=marine sediment metagenome TaxID=412755 RepID=A0A0F9MY90_9ZZZZ